MSKTPSDWETLHLTRKQIRSMRDPGQIHELVFTDRAARPAKWQTRCGRTDVPVEATMTPTPTSYYQVTCKDCLAAAQTGQVTS